ncbi:hypothetical protein KL942_000183 [Ogataea angusta]|uniref:Uncharacterized protein n=1 Tax=Pichia angusta TaxID=870730 RepID=A0ABQ7S457_PICAN|nr:hypothetical protein KL942_000183 [Ogataea angusta]KAG7852761.1 hypothetical protein KL940_000462 [Ogataea angusta]KAG7863492.1 hypothetical protein KL919_000807 [Ogataea angusta]
MNCQKASRKCDYSIKLIWGGRPYKNPRVEKLNPVAGLSRTILQQSNPNSQGKVRIKQEPQERNLFLQPESAAPTVADGSSSQSLHENIRSVSNILDSMYDSANKPSQILENFEPYLPQPPPADVNLTDMVDDYSDDIMKLELFHPRLQSNLHATPFIQERKWSGRMSKWDTEDLEDDDASLAMNREFSTASNTYSLSRTYSESSTSEILEPVPRGLVPLPDLLLNVPDYYEAFNFFFSSTAQLFMPFGDAVQKYNPFKKVLPQLAFSNDGLLAVTVAYGLAHKSYLTNQSEPAELLEQLLSRSLGDLLELLQNKETSTSDLTLTLVLLISSFMVFTFKHNWEVHLNGAKQILLLRGYKKPFEKLFKESKNLQSQCISGEIKRSKLIFFLLRWFAYIDVLAQLASPLEPTPQEIEKYTEKLKITELCAQPSDFDYEFESNEDAESLMVDESHANVDYFLGFNIKYLPLYKKTTVLIKQANLRALVNPSAGVLPSVIDLALQMAGTFQRLSSVSSQNQDTIIAINRVFTLFGLNQIYRRVLKVPKSSPLIQDMCAETISIIDLHLLDDSPNQISIFLPVFVSGCDSSNEELRFRHLRRMTTIAHTGSPSAQFAVDLMTQCWERDQDWWHVMQKEDKKHLFF